MLNNFDYMGRFVADPELVTSTNGTSYTRFCLAQDEGKGDKKTTTYLDFVAYGKTAETICKFCKKGSLIVVDQCRITTSMYEDKAKDVKRKNITFTVNHIEFVSGSGNSETSKDIPAPAPKSAPADSAPTASDDLPF